MMQGSLQVPAEIQSQIRTRACEYADSGSPKQTCANIEGNASVNNEIREH